MSAGDALQPKQFYHASDHEFAPGEHVLSPNARNDPNSGHQVSADNDSVFMTGSRADAQGWGKHIYHVEPHTEPEHSWVGHGVYTTKSATVVKEIHDKRLRGY